MAEQVIKIEKVYYPKHEAIAKAAEQNLNRDRRKGLIDDDPNEDVIRKYIEEANVILMNKGCNSIPEYPDYEHIHVVGGSMAFWENQTPPVKK